MRRPGSAAGDWRWVYPRPVVYEQDPRTGPQVLAQPSLVMVGGEVVTTRGSLA